MIKNGQITIMGDIYMGSNQSRNMSGFTFNNSDVRNANFQGENTNQTYTEGITDEFLKTLLSEINKIPDSDEKNDAVENAKKLKDALDKGDIERGKKIFGWLPTVVQSAASVITIAQGLGLL
jgi:hypothetical protein